MILLAGAIAMSAAAARSGDQVKVRISNPTEIKWNVEIRDLVCDEKVIYQGKMKPGESRKLRICADDAGAGRIVAIVAGGCASAKATVFDGLGSGDEVIVAQTAAAEDEDLE
jgi:hypothetical protein